MFGYDEGDCYVMRVGSAVVCRGGCGTFGYERSTTGRQSMGVTEAVSRRCA
jgi:hypothetical protein